MENLTKQQLILLALLVSFVSSIATGIVTVSLFDQASPTVTQTINRIVERTVETVAPATSGDKATVKETVIVSESDALVAAIEKASKGIVRVRGSSGFEGLGVLISDSGRIVAKVNYQTGTNYRVTLPDGSDAGLDFVSSNSDYGLTVFQVTDSSSKSFPKVTFSDTNTLKIGQTVVAVGGESSNSVESGIISSLTTNEKGTVTRVIAGISGGLYAANSVLIDLSGQIVGLKTGTSVEEGYIPSETIKSLTN